MDHRCNSLDPVASGLQLPYRRGLGPHPARGGARGHRLQSADRASDPGMKRSERGNSEAQPAAAVSAKKKLGCGWKMKDVPITVAVARRSYANEDTVVG